MSIVLTTSNLSSQPMSSMAKATNTVITRWKIIINIIIIRNHYIIFIITWNITAIRFSLCVLPTGT